MTMTMFKRRLMVSVGITILLMVLSALFFTPPLFAADNAQAEAAAGGKDLMWVVISAAVAFSFGALAAGFAISHVGSAAMGAMSEKPEIGAQALIFIALAEGLVVFGFITALMILGKV